MKVYVLEIGYDSKKDKIEYIKEYIDNAKAIVNINDEEIPDRYLKLSTKLDRARLRKDIIKDGDTDYASVPKVKRLKIK